MNAASPTDPSETEPSCLLGSSGQEPGELQEVGTPRFDSTWLRTVLERLKDWGAAAGLVLASVLLNVPMVPWTLASLPLSLPSLAEQDLQTPVVQSACFKHQDSENTAHHAVQTHTVSD